MSTLIQLPTSIRDAAVALAGNGFHVFKLKVNLKTPAVSKYYDVASNDPKKVFDLWSAPVTGDPLQNNIGILTGGDFMVVDVDVKGDKQGLETLDKLIDFRGFPTNTVTARSPTGSLHYFLKLPKGRDARNTVEKIGPGVDTRGHHGYVVAAGSITKDGVYEWYVAPNPETEDEMAPAPDWLLDICETRREAPSDNTTQLVTPDDEAAIKRAIDYLKNSAPEATLRAGSNTVTYSIAAKVKDFGVSQQTAFELMLEHWNEEKSNPPWPPEKLLTVVENAYTYGQEAIGRSSAHADFTAVDIEPQPEWPQNTKLEPFDLDGIEPRRWIVQDLLAACFVHALVSPGGMGKTQFIINLCLAIAGKLDAVLGMHVNEQTGVWYWNQEDSMPELKRRFAAAMRHHGVTWEQVGDRISLDTGVEKPLVLVKRGADGRVFENTKVVNQIIARIRAEHIGAFIFDPLIEFHEAEENDNVEMRTVMATARRIAVEGNCAVLAVAHTRKPSGASSDGFAGDADTMRGGGSQVNVTRLVHTLFSMSIKDAKQFGVPPDQRHLYVRLDGGKSNISLLTGKPLWMRRVSVKLGRGDGESVGVLEPVALAARGPEVNLAHILAEAIGAKLTRGDWHSVTDILAVMPEHEQALFGDKKNRARVLTTNFDGLGLETAGGTVVELMTDAGTVRIVNRKGPIGFQFLLKPT